MIRVNFARELGHRITSYEVEDMTDGTKAELRPEQLPDFCILRKFVNAVYRDGTLVSDGDGFEVRSALSGKEERKERLYQLFTDIVSSEINVIGYVPESTARCDSTEFVVSCGGLRGVVEVYPGTEYFNRSILEMLNIKGVHLSDCRTIHPSHGYTEFYKGWKQDNVLSAVSMEEPDFTIRARKYSEPSWCRSSEYSKFDICWELYAGKSIQGTAFVGKDNRLLHMEVYH